jgi:CHASE3 domain sensor protein
MKQKLAIGFVIILLLAGGYAIYRYAQQKSAEKAEQLDTVKVCIEAMSDFQQFFEAGSFEMALHCYDGGYDLLTGFEPTFDDVAEQKDQLLELYEAAAVQKQYSIAKKRVEDAQFQ